MQDQDKNSELEVWKPILSNIGGWKTKKELELEKLEKTLIGVPVLPEKYTDEQLLKLLPEIAVTEKQIASFSKIEKAVKEERLTYTREVDELVKKELMRFEKKYIQFQEDLKKKLLPLKIAEDQYKRKVAARNEVIANFKRRCLNDLNEQTAEMMRQIHQKVTMLYKNALDEEADLKKEDYLEAYKNTFSEDDFVLKIPAPTASDDELQLIADSIYLDGGFSSEDMLLKFIGELDIAFRNFESDKSDKENAKRLRDAVQEAAIKEETKQETVNSMFVEQIVIARSEVLPQTKSLKKKMKLDMPQNKDTMFEVLKVYAPLLDTADKYYNGRNYFDVIEAIVKIVENMKNDGVDIPSLNFKEDVNV